MLLADGALGFLLLGLWLFCIFDVITTPQSEVQLLPKLVWLLIVLFLLDIGSIIWLVAGRRRRIPGRPASADSSNASPEDDRPGRAEAGKPEDDELFLRQLRDRAEAQRRAHDERRRREHADEHDRLRKPPEEL